MGLFRGIYNWLAQRNIGKLFGLQWDPSKDIGYQRQNQEQFESMMAAQHLQVSLPNADQAIKSRDYEKAYRLTNRILLELPNSNSPYVGQARKEAERIFKLASQHVEQPDKSSNDYFNDANALYQTVRNLRDGSDEYKSRLAEIVKLCQLSIQKDHSNGDAHVMLASAYYMLALHGQNTDLYNYCIGRSGSVIHKWKASRMHTRNKANGRAVYDGINAHLAEAYPTLPPYRMAMIHESRYFSAVDPEEFSTLAAILE